MENPAQVGLELQKLCRQSLFATMSTWEGAERVNNIFENADEDKDGQLSKDELRG